MPVGLTTGPQMLPGERHRPLCSPPKALSSPGVASFPNHCHLWGVAPSSQPRPSTQQARGLPALCPHIFHPIPPASLPWGLSSPLWQPLPHLRLLSPSCDPPQTPLLSSPASSPSTPTKPPAPTSVKGIFLKDSAGDNITALLHNLLWLPVVSGDKYQLPDCGIRPPWDGCLSSGSPAHAFSPSDNATLGLLREQGGATHLPLCMHVVWGLPSVPGPAGGWVAGVCMTSP